MSLPVDNIVQRVVESQGEELQQLFERKGMLNFCHQSISHLSNSTIVGVNLPEIRMINLMIVALATVCFDGGIQRRRLQQLLDLCE